MKTTSRFFLCLLFLFVSLNCYANYKSEKIHLMVEKEQYKPGDTIYVHGFLVNSETLSLDSYSKYLYVELFDSKDSVLIQEKTACPKGLFSLGLPIDTYMSTGTYYIRAYSQLMQNEAPWSYPLLPVRIAYDNPVVTYDAYTEKIHSVAFYPEGGRLVNNCPQQVVFEVTDRHDLPISCTAELRNDNDSILLSAIPVGQDGKGVIRFTPDKNRTFHLRVYKDGTNQNCPLPQAENTPSLQLNINRNRLSFTRITPNSSPEQHLFTLYFRGMPCLSDTLSERRTSGVLDISTFPAGIYVGILTDLKKHVIAERMIFHHENNAFYDEKASPIKCLPNTSLSLTSLFPEDTAKHSFYRIQRIDTTTKESAPHTIASYLWLESELRLSGAERLAISRSGFDKQIIDKILICKKWKRFDLSKNFQEPILYPHKPELVLSLSGSVETELGNRPIKEGLLVAINTDTGMTYEGNIHTDGSFEMGVDDFTEGQNFFLQAYNAKGKPGQYTIVPENKRYRIIDNPLKSFYQITSRPPTHTGTAIIKDSLISYYDIKNERQAILPDIQIAARVRNKDTIATADFYTQHKITEELIRKMPYGDIIPYLDRLIGIHLAKVPLSKNIPGEEESTTLFRYAICTTRGVSVLSKRDDDPYGLHPNEMPIILDGSLADTHQVLTTLAPQDISSIERLTPAQALVYTSKAINGALIIRTRTYKEEKRISLGMNFQPKGLSATDNVVKQGIEFINAPDTPGTYWILQESINKQGIPLCFTRTLIVEP